MPCTYSIACQQGQHAQLTHSLPLSLAGSPASLALARRGQPIAPTPPPPSPLVDRQTGAARGRRGRQRAEGGRIAPFPSEDFRGGRWPPLEVFIEHRTTVKKSIKPNP